MVLSEKEIELIINKIEIAISKKTGQRGFKCTVCTNNQFSLPGGFTNNFLMDRIGGGLILGGPVLPSVPIICTNCGNTLFLNAKVLGLKEEDKKEEKNE